MSEPIRNVMIVGVGGQGVILVSKVLAALAASHGYEVKQSEVHGMAKRGGAVFSHVRFGSRVWSPTIPMGETDVLVALEWAEAMRWLPHLRPGTGALFCDTKQIVPPFSCRNRRPGAALSYSQETPAEVREHVGQAHAIDATTEATALGNERAANVVLLGAMSTALDFPVAEWERVLAEMVPPRTIEVNLAAFRRGRELAQTDLLAVAEDRLIADTARLDAGGVADGAVALQAGGVGDPAIIDARASAVEPAGDYDVRVEITPSWCKSCDICVKLCPERCLHLNDERVAELTDAALCTGCRLCEWLCPDFAIRVHLEPHQSLGAGASREVAV